MKTLRYMLAAAVALLFLLLLVIVGMAGDTLLSLWSRLQTSPWYVSAFFAIILSILTFISAFILWKLLAPAKKSTRQVKIVDEASLRNRVVEAEASGVSVAAAKDELRKLSLRRDTGKLYIALAGSISMGKSSLINSLLPDATAQTSVTGGTTQEITEYHWQAPAGDEIILIDLPGLFEAGGTQMPDAIRDEAIRAHIIIYLCDSDLTRQQLQELEQLAGLSKPMILALNKSDWYSKQELEQILQRLRQHTSDIPDISIVSTSTRQDREVVLRLADGSESTEIRTFAPDIKPLAAALQKRIDKDPDRLESLRDSAIFTLAAQRLDQAELEQRIIKGQQLVRNHTRSAVAGAMAAISPGTDILIQGALGISLVKSLCSLYDIPVSQLEIDRLLKQGQSRLNRHLALIMAVLGNALKAFPGVGTLAGGAVHAVTYGLIFDALGRSLNETLASRGELESLPVLNTFTENLGDQLEKRSSDIIRLVLESREENTAKNTKH
jgi:small GTP-binding protein